jgi:hypothetical protein
MLDDICDPDEFRIPNAIAHFADELMNEYGHYSGIPSQLSAQLSARNVVKNLAKNANN